MRAGSPCGRALKARQATAAPEACSPWTAASLCEQSLPTAQHALSLQPVAQRFLEHLQRHARAMSTVFERAKDELTLRPCKHQARLAALAAEQSLPAWLARKRCLLASQLLQANAKLMMHAPVCWLQVAGHLFEGRRPKFTSLPSMSYFSAACFPARGDALPAAWVRRGQGRVTGG